MNLDTLKEDEVSEYLEIGGNGFRQSVMNSEIFYNSGFFGEDDDDDSAFLSAGSYKREELTQSTLNSNEEGTIGSHSQSHSHHSGGQEDDEKSVRSRLSNASKAMRLSSHSVELECRTSILAPSNKKEKELKIANFKAGRLKVTSLKLHGRDVEVATLHTCLETVYSNSTATSTSASTSTSNSNSKLSQEEEENNGSKNKNKNENDTGIDNGKSIGQSAAVKPEQAPPKEQANTESSKPANEDSEQASYQRSLILLKARIAILRIMTIDLISTS